MDLIDFMHGIFSGLKRRGMGKQASVIAKIAADLNVGRKLKGKMMVALEPFRAEYNDDAKFEDDAESAIYYFAQYAEPKLGDPLQKVLMLTRHKCVDMQAPEGQVAKMVDVLRKTKFDEEPVQRLETLFTDKTPGGAKFELLDKSANNLLIDGDMRVIQVSGEQGDCHMDRKTAAQKLIDIADAIDKQAAEESFFVCRECNHTASLATINAKRSKVASETDVQDVEAVTVNDVIACPACASDMRYVPTDISEKFYVEAADEPAPEQPPPPPPPPEEENKKAPAADKPPVEDSAAPATDSKEPAPEEAPAADVGDDEDIDLGYEGDEPTDEPAAEPTDEVPPEADAPAEDEGDVTPPMEEKVEPKKAPKKKKDKPDDGKPNIPKDRVPKFEFPKRAANMYDNRFRVIQYLQPEQVDEVQRNISKYPKDSFITKNPEMYYERGKEPQPKRGIALVSPRKGVGSKEEFPKRAGEKEETFPDDEVRPYTGPGEWRKGKQANDEGFMSLVAKYL